MMPFIIEDKVQSISQMEREISGACEKAIDQLAPYSGRISCVIATV
jgi:hypothetical protein